MQTTHLFDRKLRHQNAGFLEEEVTAVDVVVISARELGAIKRELGRVRRELLTWRFVVCAIGGLAVLIPTAVALAGM